MNLALTSADFEIRDSTAGVSAFTILKSTGNVGIGTTGPNHQLHVVRVGNDLLRLQNTSVGTTGDYRFIVDSGVLGIYDNEDAAYRIYINTSGNVGIGTTGPGSKLHVYGAGVDTGAAEVKLQNTDGSTSTYGLGVGVRGLSNN